MAFSIFIIVFVLLFAFGMPIAFTMVISSIVYALINGIDLSFYSLESFKSLSNIALAAIPMFMLTAEIMNSSTVADRMFKFANSVIGWVPGGLGHTNVLTSVIFSGMSGSAAADVGGIGYIAYKSMKDRGFDGPFSAAVTAASACIGPIIPPSIPVIVYAMTIPAASVGRLFLGGIIPGFFMAISMMIYIYFISKKRKYPIEKKPTMYDLWIATKLGILPVLTPVILLLTITLGMVTISEGAVITVLYSCFLGSVLYRQLGLKDFLMSLKNVILVIGRILMFFLASQMFRFVLAKEHLVGTLSDLLMGVTTTPFVILLIINIFFIIIGCLSDPLVNIMLFGPLAWSIAMPLGIDPNAFGLMVIFNCMIGLITPPVGGMAFIVSGLTKEPLEKIFKELAPFVFGYIVVLILITKFPSIITFIPNFILG